VFITLFFETPFYIQRDSCHQTCVSTSVLNTYAHSDTYPVLSFKHNYVEKNCRRII